MPDGFNTAVRENAAEPDGTGLPITYRDQWGCASRFLCRQQAREERTIGEPHGDSGQWYQSD